MADQVKLPPSGTNGTGLGLSLEGCPVPLIEKGDGLPGTGSTSLDDAELFTILGALDAMEVSFDLTLDPPRPPRPPVVFDPPLLPDAVVLLGPWRGWLEWVALGRYHRHAPTQCERCGFIAMARVIQTRAVPEEGKPAGWRANGRCSLCGGRRAVPHPPTFKRERKRAG